MIHIFGLTGFLSVFVSLIISILIITALVILLLPFIFRHLVSPHFDGSYNYKKDTIKSTGKLSEQTNEFTLELDKDTQNYSINFGKDRQFTNGEISINHNGKIYTLQEGLKFVSETETDAEIETQLGKGKKTTWKFSIENTQFQFEISFITLTDENLNNILIFETSSKTGISNISNGDIKTGVFNFPVFTNDSPNQRIFSYKHIVFCPGTRDFEYSRAPVCLFDDNKNTVIISALDNYMTNGIQKIDSPDNNQFKILCGVNGTVNTIPENHKHSYIMIFNKGINNSFKFWGDCLLKYNGVSRDDKNKYRETDQSYLGYYTDNGADYYYKPIKNLGYDGTLKLVQEYAEKEEIPFKYYHLDSFWYSKSVKKVTRNVLGPVGRVLGGSLYGGTYLWEPDPDPAVFKEPLENLVKEFAQKGICFTAHNRWYSDKSPYIKKYPFFVEEKSSMPKNSPEFWDEIMDVCLKYNISTYEQDWISTHMTRFKFLNEEIGAGRLWLKNMADAAEKRDLGIQYCMAVPCTILASTELKSVITARASGDYNSYWPKVYDTPYFMQASMLMWSAGLWPFKDTFNSSRYGYTGEKRPILMALTSALSAGQVAPGDKIGKINKESMDACCRKDGLLYKPDRPMTATDITYIKNRKYYISSTESTHGNNQWHYVLTANYWKGRVKENFYTLNDIDINAQNDYIEYDWFTKKANFIEINHNIQQKLGKEKYNYKIFAPVMRNANNKIMSLIGDPSKYVMISDKEFQNIKIESNSLSFEINNIKNEVSEVLIYLEEEPKSIKIDGNAIEEYTYEKESNLVKFIVEFTQDGTKNVLIS